MSILSEHVVEFSGKFYKISRVAYTGNSTTFLVDQSASSVAVLEPASGVPSASLGSASSTTFQKTVTLAAGSVAATVTVITAHNGTPAGTKP